MNLQTIDVYISIIKQYKIVELSFFNFLLIGFQSQLTGIVNTITLTRGKNGKSKHTQERVRTLNNSFTQDRNQLEQMVFIFNQAVKK